MTSPIDSRQDKIGEALNLQQVSIVDIEVLKQDLEESRVILPDRLKGALDKLLTHSVKTSRILQELVPAVKPEDVKLETGVK